MDPSVKSNVVPLCRTDPTTTRQRQITVARLALKQLRPARELALEKGMPPNLIDVLDAAIREAEEVIED